MGKNDVDLLNLKSFENTPYAITLDDDPLAAKIIEETLGLKNFWFKASKDLLSRAAKFQPMGAFIDIHLEGECGLDIVPAVRTIWPTTAIIVMTGDDSDHLVGQALASGADDFIRKPINPAEVLARLKARLEDLKDKNGHTLLRFGDLRVDTKHKSVTGPGGQLILSTREIELIAELIRANGVVIPKDVLKRELWHNVAVSDNALDRKIFEVRKALKEVSRNVELQSIYGVGMVLRLRSFDEDRVMLDDFEARIRTAREDQTSP
ncbi:MAG: response regulator transcription factor [Oligoflexus sp.]